MIAPVLARAGLKVVGLEAVPYRTRRDFVPDELSPSYYARGAMGAKFLSETPRWLLREGEPTRDATFTLGRMMNGVGGSVVHWGGALRRCHPHHFGYLTHIRENFGEKVLPHGHTLADWPVTYEDLEPYYTTVEYLAGVAGDGEDNPFIPRSKPYPMPPLRPFRTGEITARDGRDEDLARPALRGRHEQPRSGGMPYGRRPYPLGREPRARGSRYARPLRLRRCRLSHVPRRQPDERCGPSVTGRRRDWSDVCARECKDNQLGGRNEDRACRDGLLPPAAGAHG